VAIGYKPVHDRNSPEQNTPHKAGNGVNTITCRNRHCPKCQTNAREKWLTARQRELLPVDFVTANLWNSSWVKPPQQCPNAYLAMVTQNDPLWESKRAVVGEFSSEPLVPPNITSVRAQQEIANVDEASGAQAPPYLRQYFALFFIVRHARQDGEEQHEVE
jgi:hypothetical protein